MATFYSTLTGAPGSKLRGVYSRFVVPTLSQGATYGIMGLAILVLDIFTSRFLQFPILFVVPVALSSWFCRARVAYWIAFLLPLGRLGITTFLETPTPFAYALVNCLIRVAVLVFIAFLASRTAQQTRELQQRVNTLVTICAWSHTVNYQGKWISFEEYLLRQFKINTSHGISPAQAERIIKQVKDDEQAF